MNEMMLKEGRKEGRMIITSESNVKLFLFLKKPPRFYCDDLVCVQYVRACVCFANTCT